MDIARRRVTRKAAFASALDLAGLKQAEWADLNGVNDTHLSKYLNGHRESGPLGEKVDAFIAQYLPHVEIEERAPLAAAG